MSSLSMEMPRELKPSLSPSAGWAIGGIAPLGLLFLWPALCDSLQFTHPAWASWMGSILAATILVAAVLDGATQKIPNWLTYCAFLWGVAINLLAVGGESVARFFPISLEQFGAVGLGESLGGGFVCFAIMLFIYRLAGSGAGDVKLAAAIGALVGLRTGLGVLIWSYVVAGAAIIIWFLLTVGPVRFSKIMLKKFGSMAFPNAIDPPSEEENSLVTGKRIRLGPAFAVGTVLTIDYANLFGGN